jgi:anti-sigma B factor antagonist
MTAPSIRPELNSCHLTIERRDEANGVLLTIRGEIDIASAPALERELRDAESASPGRIVLNLADLEFLDSTGVGALIQAQARSASSGHRLVVTHVPPTVQRLFELTGLNARLTIE